MGQFGMMAGLGRLPSRATADYNSAVPDESATPFGSYQLADELQQLCASCEQHVMDAIGVALDGTIETLPVLDHYLRVSVEAVRERPQLLPLITRTAGAYFGQVVANHFGGFWWLPDADVNHWYVCFRPVYMAFNPIAVVHAALTWGDENAPGGPRFELKLAREDRALVETRLAALPPVKQEDFYALCTRVEAFEVAFAALSEQMAQAGTADVVFDEDDYSDDLGDPQLGVLN